MKKKKKHKVNIKTEQKSIKIKISNYLVSNVSNVSNKR